MVIKKLPTDSLTFTLVAALASLLAVILAMWGVTGQKRAFLTKKIELQKLTNDLMNLDKILSDEKMYRDATAKVMATLPKGYDEVATAVAAIELTAKTNNLATDFSIDPKAKEEAGIVKSIGVIVRTTGSFSDITKFASDVSQLPYHTKVNSLTFDEAGGKVSATLSIRLYMQ